MSPKWLILLAFLLTACQENQDQLSKPKPNVILMVADDMGWADLACYGGAANTPNLDKLAATGIRFTDFYAAAPNCSPSRVGLMTGRSPAIVGMYNYRPPGHPIHLPDEEITIAEVLQKEGYATSHIGKWHLGCLPQDATLNHPQPKDQGFDYSLGTENNAQPSHLNPVNFVRNGVKLPEQKGYSCQILAGEFIDWMDGRTDNAQPFFSYLAFHEPHAKIASPPELIEKYSDYPTKDAEYLANIENLDAAVGRVMDYLEAKDLMENTLILFTSDNGSYRQASNGPLRAVKSYVYEGGIRVPGMLHWPGIESKAEIIDEAVGFVDILPTICELLEIKPPNEAKLDGTSFLPLLKGQKLIRTKPLYWYFYRTSPEIAMRVDEFMILGKDIDTIPRTHRFSEPDMTYIKNMYLESYEIYDLQADQGQFENKIDHHPQVDEFKQLLDQQLVEIQKKGYLWTDLPTAKGTKKLKTDWVKYKR
ncbi:MAG: sulfatase-like hydrolase/transferase [Bacteroidota bacterium]